MIILHYVLFIALCDSWFSWISFVQSAFGGDTSDPLKAHSQNCISHCLCFSIHNWLFGILQNFYFTSLNFLFEFVQNLIESWLSKSDISLMTILEFGLCLCHFIITLFDLLTFSKFWQIIWNCISECYWLAEKTLLCYVSCNIRL